MKRLVRYLRSIFRVRFGRMRTGASTIGNCSAGTGDDFSIRRYIRRTTDSGRIFLHAKRAELDFQRRKRRNVLNDRARV